MKVLLVDDSGTMRTIQKRCLTKLGIVDVVEAEDGRQALEFFDKGNYNGVLSDWNMPVMDGLALLKEIRQRNQTIPVIMITTEAERARVVAAIQAGVSDYLVKPFSTEELLARVRALLRRTQRHGKSPTKLTLGDVEIDLARQTAGRGRKQIHLTAKEFAMLRLLAEAAGEPVSREKFLDVVWGYAAYPTTRTVDNHIANLRAKLEKNPESPRWLKTVHGVGYKLDL